MADLNWAPYAISADGANSAIHGPLPRAGGELSFPFTWQQLQQIVANLVNEFLRQVAVALGAIEIFGFKPYEALVEIGAKIQAGVDNFNILLSAFGLPTVNDVATLLADQANDFATFLAATGQATFAALGAALQALIDFLTAIPANLLSGAMPTTVTLSGTQLGTLLQYINSSGQFAAAQLTGALNTGLTFSGTALSVLLQYLNSSGQFSAAQLTGGINTAVTFGGTQLGTLLQYLNSSGQFAAGQLTGAINGSLTLGGVTLSTLVTNINSSGQILAAGITGALGTGLTVGGVTLSTLFTNINSSGQLVLSGATGALNTAVTISGQTVSTLSTNWNGAVTNISNLLSGSGLATTTLVGSNLAQIGTAITNAAAGTLGPLGAVATQVQTGFSNLISGLFGGLTGTPTAATYSQAQVETAAQAVVTNAVGNAATFVGLQNDAASNAALMSYSIKFGDYGVGTFSLPAAFTLSNDNSYYAGTNGSIEIVNGRAVYKKSGTGTSQKIARYNVAPTTTDYQEISWVHTGNQEGSPSLTAIYARMNSAATSYLKFELQNGNSLNMVAVVAGSPTAVGGITNNLKPAAKYTIRMGDLAGITNIYVYENEVLISSVSDAVHQKGASYRYAGFGFSGENTGTQPNNFGIDVFSVADQVFKPGPPATAYVSTQQATALPAYTDLATTTDQVTVTIGSSGMALVTVQASGWNSGLNYGMVSHAISGATTRAASDDYCGLFVNPSAGWQGDMSNTSIQTGLNPGLNTFKMKYKTNAGTQQFFRRRISVIPL